MKVLNIISTPWRATIEEQDDTIIWLTHAMVGAGAEIDVVFTGEAAGYAVTGMDARGLSFGQLSQTQPPDINQDISNLIEKGRKVYVCGDSLSHLGITSDFLAQGLSIVAGKELVQLFDNYDQVWQW